MERASLYEFAGGMPAFLELAAAHHQRRFAVSHPGQPDHVERLASYWAEALGGPGTYSDASADIRRRSKSTSGQERATTLERDSSTAS